MAARHGLVIVALIALMTVGACGQGGAAATGTGGVSEPSAVGGTTVAPSIDAATAEPDSTVAPSAAASEAAASAGTDATGECSLISAQEASGILGFAVTSLPIGDGITCIYEVSSAGANAAATQLFTTDADAIFNDFKGQQGATAVPGLGDDAIWLPAYLSLKLYILKGDKVLAVLVGNLNGVPVPEQPEQSPEELLSTAKQLGTLALGRI